MNTKAKIEKAGLPETPARPPLPDFRADPALALYRPALERRMARANSFEKRLAGSSSLADFASAHEWYGLHRRNGGGWVFREFAPNATRLWLVGDATRWERLEKALSKR